MTKKEKITNFIKNNIENGIWKPGDKILGEDYLSEKLSVSRNTVRLALSELQHKGIIERVHGSGTYIKQQTPVKRFILIFTREYNVAGDTKFTPKYLFENIDKYLNQKHYKAVYYIKNDLVNLQQSIAHIENEIAGVIFYAFMNKELEYLQKLNIPLIETMSVKTNRFPCTFLDYYYMYYNIEKIIQGKNALIFSIKRESRTITQINSTFPFIIEKLWFEKYDFHEINFLHTQDLGLSKIINILDNLKEIPEYVVFLDDNLFKLTEPYFNKYKHIFENTKIITQINDDYEYKGTLNITKFQFNIKEIAEKTVDLLLKLINGEKVTETNIIIKPQIKR